MCQPGCSEDGKGSCTTRRGVSSESHSLSSMVSAIPLPLLSAPTWLRTTNKDFALTVLAFSGSSTRRKPRGEDMRHSFRVSSCVASHTFVSPSQQTAMRAQALISHRPVRSVPWRSSLLQMVPHGGQRPELTTALDFLKQVVRAAVRSCTRAAVHTYSRVCVCSRSAHGDKTGQR